MLRLNLRVEVVLVGSVVGQGKELALVVELFPDPGWRCIKVGRVFRGSCLVMDLPCCLRPMLATCGV